MGKTTLNLVVKVSFLAESDCIFCLSLFENGLFWGSERA